MKNGRVKEKYQTVISDAKLKQYKPNTKFLNESKDSTQFWHRYDKVLGRKTNNIFEPVYNTESGLHIFDDQEISEKLKKFHIEKLEKMSLTCNSKMKLKKRLTLS